MYLNITRAEAAVLFVALFEKRVQYNARSCQLVSVGVFPLHCGHIQSPKSVTLIKLIEGVQRGATRLLLPNLTHNDRLQQLNLRPLVYRREVKDITTFYKLKCGLYNYSVERYFEFCSDKRLRSFSSNKLKINKVRTELFKGTFFNRLPYLWNNLPDKLRTSNLSLSLFKKQCNDFYKKKSFDPDRPHATRI